MLLVTFLFGGVPWDFSKVKYGPWLQRLGNTEMYTSIKCMYWELVHYLLENVVIPVKSDMDVYIHLSQDWVDVVPRVYPGRDAPWSRSQSVTGLTQRCSQIRLMMQEQEHPAWRTCKLHTERPPHG